MLVHEGLHVVAARVLGYRARVRVQVGLPAVYTVAPAQYWRRWDLAAAALTPLLVIDVVTLGAIVGTPLVVGVPAVLAFVVNTVGSTSDLRILGMAVRSPAGTRFYDTPDGTGYEVESGE